MGEGRRNQRNRRRRMARRPSNRQEGTQSWATGRYEGELADGEPNGHGVLTMQKLRYEGDFRKRQTQWRQVR